VPAAILRDARKRAFLTMTAETDLRHCEQRSDEAIQLVALDCFGSLAMTDKL
jgi:hypothetical protein